MLFYTDASSWLFAFSERVANGTTPAFPVWAQHQPGAFDAAVRAALRELLWDDEQRRAHSEREAGRAEAEAAAERTARYVSQVVAKQDISPLSDKYLIPNLTIQCICSLVV